MGLVSHKCEWGSFVTHQRFYNSIIGVTFVNFNRIVEYQFNIAK